tara:strand:+ start:4800 stop:5453 length:654 start_codon:yes stop_codon:yes gene_type:complete
MRIFGGRVDVIAQGKKLTVLDIKTGAEADWHRTQLETYARLLENEMKRVGKKVRFPSLAAVYLSINEDQSYIRWHKRIPNEEYDAILAKLPVEYEVSIEEPFEDYQLLFEPDGHTYYLKKKQTLTRIPGVSEFLEATGQKRKYKNTGTESPFATFGTGIHEWVEAAHRGEDVLNALKNLDDKEAADVIERYLFTWQQILQRQELAIIANERAVWGQL